MSPNMSRHNSVWKTKIFWKLTLVNLLVIGIVIWIAGVSVKDFACFLANELNIIGEQRTDFFNRTMDFYLIRASIIAFLAATVIHYVWIRKFIIPIQTLTDATKRMRDGAEAEFVPVKSNDEVGQLTKQFNGFIQKLKRSEELRNQMTADLAHEVRTPLSNITGYLEALKNGVIEPDRELLTSLHGEAERLKKMIEQLYHVSEREWNHHLNEKPPEPLHIKVMIEKMVALHAMELQKQHIEVETVVEEAYLSISEDKMKQIVGNLLDNAIRYSVDDTVIKITGRNLHTSYILEIAGKGQPIPLHAADRLFDRFYRVDPSRSRQSGGNGLGLAIVKELVEREKGNVWLETDRTYHRFFIRVPLIT